MVTETVMILDLLLASLTILTLIYSTSKKVNFSILSTVIITICADTSLMVVMDYVLKIEDLHLLNFLWFTGIAFLHVMVCYSILFVHVQFGLMMSTFAKITMVIYLTMSFFQLITYFDHVHFKTTIVSSAYQVVIPACELFFTSCMALFLLRELLRTNPLERYMN